MTWRDRRLSRIDYNHQLSKPRPGFNGFNKPRRLWRYLGLAAAIIIIGAVAWVGTSGWRALKNMTDGQESLFKFLTNPSPRQLAGEGEGRTNILLMGIGGKGHPGGTLADTIMLMSIDAKNKKVALVSVPRDLYVPIAGNGYGKINSAHSYGESNTRRTGGGPAVMKETVSDIFDLPIHYYIRADFDAMRKLVDTLGGITVDVPKAIRDPFYPDERMVGYAPFYVKKGINQFDGTTALKYARSRETTSDFDRARRQQQILLAIKDKALSAGVLSNPKKVVDIMGVLGDHVLTDLKLQEMEHLAQVSKDINASNVRQVVLDNGPNGPLVSATGSVGYYLKPRTGDFREIQRIVKEIFKESSQGSEAELAVAEKAVIEVRNATGSVGYAPKVATQLRSDGYSADPFMSALAASGETVLYDNTNGQKKFTAELLTDRFHARSIKRTRPSGEKADFVLVLGADYLKLASRTN